MKKNLAILLWAANPDEPHRCSAPFFHAAAAAAMDVNVEIYFTGKSILLLRQGVAAALPSGPRERETVYSFMRHAAEHGAKFFACSEAMEEQQIRRAEFIDEIIEIGGAAAFVARVLDEDWATLTY
ncbi:MAG: DsrE/DsrF/DrsH-like family protein [Burkholderiales bacterium]